MNSSDYDHVYNYTPAPIMPGIRKLHGVPEEKYIVDYEFDAERDNFVPSHVPYYNNPRPDLYYGGLPIFEGFNSTLCPGGLTKILILVLVIIFIIYLTRQN